MRVRRSELRVFGLTLALLMALPISAFAQTAWLYAFERTDWHTDLPSTMGIHSRVGAPRETVFGTLPRAGMFGEVALTQGIIVVGDAVPLPLYADGTPAVESEIFWTAQLWRAGIYMSGIAEYGNQSASAIFSGRRLVAASLNLGLPSATTEVQVLVQVVAVRPHDNRRSNR